MYKRLSAIMFPIALVLLIGSVYWGYQEHQEKNSILIKAENQYQRAFHDLTYHVDKLHQQLGNTLAVNSTSQGYHRKGLVNAWRLSSQAQNEISQLPLSYLPFTDAEDFLSRISNFAYKTSVRDLTKQPLTEDEFKTLNTLYEKSKEISKDLNHMQQQVLSNNMRWMDIEIAIAKDSAKGGNIIVDGLRDVDKRIGEYPELNWGPSVASMYEKRSFKALGGEAVSAEQIKEKAAKLLKADPSTIEVVENGNGTDYASYSAVQNKNDPAKSVHMNFTRQGGKLMMYMKNRNLGKAAISMDQAKASADAFLEQYGYKNMKAVSFDNFEQTGTFTYVGSQNGVLIYPDKLTVKVAMDNGEAIGLQAGDYVQKHVERELASPTLSSAEAREALNPNMSIKHERLAIIDGEMGEEVLCYEFTGQINGGLYRIYINAESGIEESIEQMSTMDEQVETAEAKH
ncbi:MULTISPECIES: germination protein YpeB [unclassified Paenibacillus]|uniref:germination protein YpeB n=1 Tax=unclassified Paenibacillus TaxID=185978 RepID=UPI002F3FC527